MKGISSLSQYIKDSRSELKKVTWPTRKDTVNHTILVVVFSLAVAAFLGIADYLLTEIFENLVLH